MCGSRAITGISADISRRQTIIAEGVGMTTLTELGEMLISGKQIEFRDKVMTDSWRLLTNDKWDLFEYEYRLKPVPVKTYYRLFFLDGDRTFDKSFTPFEKDVGEWELSHAATMGETVTYVHDIGLEE